MLREISRMKLRPEISWPHLYSTTFSVSSIVSASRSAKFGVWLFRILRGVGLCVVGIAGGEGRRISGSLGMVVKFELGRATIKSEVFKSYIIFSLYGVKYVCYREIALRPVRPIDRDAVATAGTLVGLGQQLVDVVVRLRVLQPFEQRLRRSGGVRYAILVGYLAQHSPAIAAVERAFSGGQGRCFLRLQLKLRLGHDVGHPLQEDPVAPLNLGVPVYRVITQGTFFQLLLLHPRIQMVELGRGRAVDGAADVEESENMLPVLVPRPSFVQDSRPSWQSQSFRWRLLLRLHLCWLL